MGQGVRARGPAAPTPPPTSHRAFGRRGRPPGGAPAPVASGAWRNDGIQNECSAFHSEGLVEGQGAL